MIKIALNIKNENFNWLTYEDFKNIQKEIIAIETDVIEDNTLDNLIKSDLNKGDKDIEVEEKN